MINPGQNAPLKPFPLFIDQCNLGKVQTFFYTGRCSLTDAFAFAIAISMGTTKLATNAPWQKIRTLSSIELCHNQGKLRFIPRFS
jgi:hypothetical protein